MIVLKQNIFFYCVITYCSRVLHGFLWYFFYLGADPSKFLKPSFRRPLIGPQPSCPPPWRAPTTPACFSPKSPRLFLPRARPLTISSCPLQTWTSTPTSLPLHSRALPSSSSDSHFPLYSSSAPIPPRASAPPRPSIPLHPCPNF